MATVGVPPDTVRQWRAGHAEALRQAQRLREASAVFRRYAGELRYHPQTGVEGRVGRELLEAAAEVHDILNAIAVITARWDEEIAWLRVQMPVLADDINRDTAEASEALRLTRAALEIFDQVALHPEPASLDAPYGHGAPPRVHPGAQCTWVAERAEVLAVALSSVALRLENAFLALSG